MLHLKNLPPLANGRARLVYAYPGRPELLIKVLHAPDSPDADNARLWYRRTRRYGRYVSYLREIEEYIALHAAHGPGPFFQTVAGLAETDLGLGLVVEAVRTKTGELAPDLSTLIRKGLFNQEASVALEKFLIQLLDSPVMVADLHGGNLVYTWSETEGFHFVMIDGLGLATIMPWKTLFPALNRRSKLAKIKNLRLRMVATMAEAAAAACR